MKKILFVLVFAAALAAGILFRQAIWSFLAGPWGMPFVALVTLILTTLANIRFNRAIPGTRSRKLWLILAILFGLITLFFGVFNIIRVFRASILSVASDSNAEAIATVIQTTGDQNEVIPQATPDAASSGLSSCALAEGKDIENLVENGQTIDNAFVFLDRSSAQVKAGNTWTISVENGVYGQVFFPLSGLTYQVRGPATLTQVGRATFWCDDVSDQNNGQYVMIDATALAKGQIKLIGQWVDVP